MNVVSALRRSFRRSKRGRKGKGVDNRVDKEEQEEEEEVGVVRREREKEEREKEERERELRLRAARSEVDLRRKGRDAANVVVGSKSEQNLVSAVLEENGGTLVNAGRRLKVEKISLLWFSGMILSSIFLWIFYQAGCFLGSVCVCVELLL